MPRDVRVAGSTTRTEIAERRAASALPDGRDFSPVLAGALLIARDRTVAIGDGRDSS